jgi:putative inorganic carbon (HCO3(-)) transporter
MLDSAEARLDGSIMSRFAEVALVLGIALAVLAFGGTEPVSFALVQIVFLATAALLVAKMPQGLVGFQSTRGFVIPTVLAAVALTQLIPLPAHLHLSIEPYATRTHLLILLSCFIVFYLAQIVSENRKRKQRLIVSLLALGTVEAFYGLVQYLSGWQHIFYFAKKYDLEEATGTYINRNHFAGMLEMILPFSVALLFYEYEKFRGRGSSAHANIKDVLTRQSLQRLLLCLFVAVVLFAALFFSRSRMGIAAACASLILIFGLAGISRLHGRMALVLSAAFVALSIGLAIWIGPGPIVERFAGVGEELTAHDQSRLAIWRDALPLVRQHALLGTGLGTFPIAYTTVQTTFLSQFVNHAHNDYLESAIDLGLPAALLLFASIFWILARAVRGFFHAHGNFERSVALGCAGSIIAILLHSMTDFNLYIPANAILFSTILGLAMAVPRVNSMAGSEAQ